MEIFFSDSVFIQIKYLKISLAKDAYYNVVISFCLNSNKVDYLKIFN